MKKVGEYISKNVISIDGEKSLLDAVSSMRENGVSSLLVKEQDKIIGIFTERDLLVRADFNNPGGLSAIKIKDLMTNNIKTADIDESYINVIDLMQKHNIRHMPVVKDGNIMGIVSVRDLMNHYHENLEHLLEETVASLSSAVEKRDPYTAGHQQRVTQLACAIAKDLGLPGKDISGVGMAAVIHDIGKMYVPAEILNKPGKLSDAEMTLIKIHPQVGYDILKGIEFPWPIADIVLQHHERLDGSGYPRGLTAEDILIEAKIITVSDVVEAMVSHRPYRPALGIDKALEHILDKRGIFYYARAVDLCVRLFREKGFTFTQNIY